MLQHISGGVDIWVVNPGEYVVGDQQSNPASRTRVVLPLGCRIGAGRFRFVHGAPEGFQVQVIVYLPSFEGPAEDLGPDRILNRSPQTDVQSVTAGSSIELEFDPESGLWMVLSTGLSEWLEAPG